MKELAEKAKKLGIEIPELKSEDIDREIKPVLRAMETAGITLDVAAFHNLEKKIGLKVADLEKEIRKVAGDEININSPVQLADLLFLKLKLSSVGLKKTQSGISTAASELKKIEDQHLIVGQILEYRELTKLISTYLKPLPTLVDENNRLHTSYGLETSTGRINSSEPNLQNIPIKGRYGSEIRKAFVASHGHKLIVSDYSQIELRVVASLASDETMIDLFKKGRDIHTETAAKIFNVSPEKVTTDQRRKAKAVNFGIVYGQTPYGLSQALVISVEEAGKYIRNYFDTFKGVSRYISKTIDGAHEDGFVETLFGAKRYLPNLNSSVRYIAEAEERMAINTPVQGSAAEILKLAMIKLKNGLGSQSQLLLTVHDELVIEVPSAEAEKVAKIVKETMESVIKLPVPLVANVGVGQNWAEAK